MLEQAKMLLRKLNRFFNWVGTVVYLEKIDET